VKGFSLQVLLIKYYVCLIRYYQRPKYTCIRYNRQCIYRNVHVYNM